WNFALLCLTVEGSASFVTTLFRWYQPIWCTVRLRISSLVGSSVGFKEEVRILCERNPFMKLEAYP
ncbi:unnamed protein product, partial [Musa banksii]